MWEKRHKHQLQFEKDMYAVKEEDDGPWNTLMASSSSSWGGALMAHGVEVVEKDGTMAAPVKSTDAEDEELQWYRAAMVDSDTEPPSDSEEMYLGSGFYRSK